MPRIKTAINSVVYCILFLYLTGNIYADKPDSFDSIIHKALVLKNTNPDSMVHYVNDAYSVANREYNYDRKLDTLIVLIDAKIRSGELLEALELCESIDEIILKNNNSNREAEILLKKGNVFQSMGLDAQALDLLLKALKSSAANISIKNKIDIYYYVALVYSNLGEIEECHKYLDLSLHLAFKHNLIKSALPAYVLYTSTFMQVDSITKYLQLADNILSKFPELNYEKVVILSKKALINKALKNYDKSKSQYLKAINISINNSFLEHLSNLYNNFSYLLMTESKYDSAKYYLDQALDISQDIKSLDMESEIYDSYSDYYEKVGDYKSALVFSNLFIEKRDQYRKQQQIQKSLFLSAIFDTEQKEKAILYQEKEILHQENNITRLWMTVFGIIAFLVIAISIGIYLRQKLTLSKSRLESVKKGRKLELADALIKGQDTERKRLAMDLHDGLGARLGALRFIVDAYFKSNEKYEEVTTSITTIHQSVRDLSHRMLPAQLEDIGLISTISNLAKSINKTDKFIVEFDTNIEERLSKKLEINLYYLIFELINNATKHSKGNSITIQLLEHGDKINLSVEDNGGGFKPESTSSGLGLKNIRSRVDYLGGKLFIDSNDVETMFLIEIPNT